MCVSAFVCWSVLLGALDSVVDLRHDTRTHTHYTTQHSAGPLFKIDPQITCNRQSAGTGTLKRATVVALFHALRVRFLRGTTYVCVYSFRNLFSAEVLVAVLSR